MTISVWKGSRLTVRARAESDGLADRGREVLALQTEQGVTKEIW